MDTANALTQPSAPAGRRHPRRHYKNPQDIRGSRNLSCSPREWDEITSAAHAYSDAEGVPFNVSAFIKAACAAAGVAARRKVERRSAAEFVQSRVKGGNEGRGALPAGSAEGP